jgi:hypothetical protein
MAKNSKKRKNGKVKKYVPKPKGISNTKMKKIMDFINAQKDLQPAQPSEIREGDSLHISENFTKKLNIEPSFKITENEVKLSDDFSANPNESEGI